MKTILIAAAAISGLGGSAGAGYYVMSRGAPPAPLEKPGYVDPIKDPQFIDMDALVIPIVEDGFIRQNVYLRLALEVDGKDAAQAVLQQKERLHHAFLMALYGGPIEAGAGSHGFDPQKVKSLVLGEAQSVLGNASVTAVRIEQAIPGGG